MTKYEFAVISQTAQFSGKGKILMGEHETLQRLGVPSGKHRRQGALESSKRGESHTPREWGQWPGNRHTEGTGFKRTTDTLLIIVKIL